MSLCQHDDCDREGIAAWNGRVFCDEHVRERLRNTADSKLVTRVRELETRLAAMTAWLEANQPDVFRRGIWDALRIASSDGANP
jgi:hypothetical protein